MAGHGCNTHTQRRRPKPRSPGPTARVTGIWRSLCARRQTERTPVNPKAVVKLPERKKARKPEMFKPSTGGFAEQAYKHRARDAGEKADLRFLQYGRRPGRDRRSASVSRDAEARGSVRPPASRAPSDLFRERNRPNDSGAEALREGEPVCATYSFIIPGRILAIRSSRQSKFVHE